MPIYAFACDACGHAFERLQKLSDADPTDCPVCSVVAVRRQLTAPQFRLAGGGWYETDFKKDGDRKRNLAGDSNEPKPAPSGESKPAEKAAGSNSTDANPAAKKAPESKPAAAKVESSAKTGSSPAAGGSS